jgi:hypothetical protein
MSFILTSTYFTLTKYMSSITSSWTVTIGWRKARPRALLLGLWCRWSIESSLLGRSGYPSTWLIVTGWGSGSSVLDQSVPLRLRCWGSHGCLPFLFCPVGWYAVLLSDGHIDQLIESVGLYQSRSLSLVFRPRRKRSRLRASVSAW